MTTQASYSSTVAGSSMAVVTIDTQHPYYLHPSDNPGMTLTTVILTEQNYNQWSRSMEIALSSKLKLGFVDGTYAMPAANSPMLVHWTRCNHMIISWILNSVSVEIRNSIVYLKTAHLIWKDLEERYAQSNVPQLFHLRTELSQLTQGSMSIAAYFTQYRTLSDELECLSVKPKCSCNKCTCDINSQMDTYEKSIQLTQFLMGLNEQYTVVRGQILIMKPLPTLSQCYAILLQEETQRVSKTTVSSERLAMSVKQNYPSKHQPAKTPGVIKRNFSENAKDIQCDYCHQTGHARDKCFCLHGYPQWHKMYGKPKPKPKFLQTKTTIANAVQVDSEKSAAESFTTAQTDTSVASISSCGLSSSQYNQLLQMLQTNLRESNTGDQLNSVTWPYFSSANSAHFAGPCLEEGTRDW